MKTIIVGAGSVGRVAAAQMIENSHQVTLVDRDPAKIKVTAVPDAEWVLGDAASPAVLEEVGARDCDALIAATGDDKVNLVVSLLAKTVFGVPRVVARANHSANEWMFNSNWGVDFVASVPRSLAAVVTTAATVGQAVEVTADDGSPARVYKIELPEDSSLIGVRPAEVSWPQGIIVGAVERSQVLYAAQESPPLESGDQLLFIAGRGLESAVAELERTVLA